MVRKTTVTFRAPTSVEDSTRAKHTDPSPPATVTARGVLQHCSMTKVQTDLGVGDANNWTYVGGLPYGVSPRTGWTAEATAERKARKFNVMGAAQGMGEWQIALAEV